MDYETEMKLLTIVDTLARHPVGQAFGKPFKVGDEVESDYSFRIKRPMDLGTIRLNLLNKSYFSVQQFLDDIELITQNAIKYFGQDTEYGAAGIEIRRLVAKSLRLAHLQQLKDWASDVYKFRTKISKLIKAPPISGVLTGLDLQQPISPQLSSEEDMKNFCRASEYLTSTMEQTEMQNIIKRHQPELLGNTLTLDVTKLKPKTMAELKTFMEKALGMRGYAYPNNR